MALTMEPTTDKRIDELSKRVDFGFEQTSRRLGRVEDDLREMRSEMGSRLDRTDEDVKAGFVRTDDYVKAGFDKADERMKAGFDKADERMKAGFDRTDDYVKAGFDKADDYAKAGFDKVADEFVAVRGEMKAGFDAMQRQMTLFFAGTLGSIVAGVIVTLLFHS
jgi:ElaB/YqjD/DUF883 family membrane-anchored ribosome-binding protein